MNRLSFPTLMSSRRLRPGRALIVMALAAAAGGAAAHTGHGTHGVVAGLVHPLGADHLLAMLAVGLWSVLALPAGRRALGPLTFIGALVAGAALGAAGLGFGLVEHAIALSVAMFGALLIAGRALPVAAALTATAAAALLHGLAHGAELPAGAAFGTYAVGFIATSAALHLAGLALGTRIAAIGARAWQGAGALLGAAGLALLLQRI